MLVAFMALPVLMLLALVAFIAWYVVTSRRIDRGG